MKFIDKLIKIQTYTAIGLIFVLCGMFYQKNSYKTNWQDKLSFTVESKESSEISKTEVKNKLNKTYLKRYIEVSFPLMQKENNIKKTSSTP